MYDQAVHGGTDENLARKAGHHGQLVYVEYKVVSRSGQLRDKQSPERDQRVSITMNTMAVTSNYNTSEHITLSSLLGKEKGRTWCGNSQRLMNGDEWGGDPRH